MIDQSLVIIPTYNEALNVHAMIEALFFLHPDISVLIVDDNSPDRTAFLVEALQDQYPQLFLIKRPSKMGLGTAYLEGFSWALERHFQYIVQMDCDFSHDPSDVRRLLQSLKQDDCAMVIGSRYSHNEVRTKDWPFHRLALSFMASLVLRTFTGMKIKDAIGGFKAFHRDTIEKLDLKNIISRGFVFQFEVNNKVHSLGLKITEVPIIFHQRILGGSKMSGGIIIEAVRIFIYLRYKSLTGTLN